MNLTATLLMLETIDHFFELSFVISAWKEIGPDRFPFANKEVSS